MFMAPDPWYGFSVYWLGCTCEGRAEEATVCMGTSLSLYYRMIMRLMRSLEVASAHQYVHNENGVLTC
jgi:hypothetical protein